MSKNSSGSTRKDAKNSYLLTHFRFILWVRIKLIKEKGFYYEKNDYFIVNS